MQTSSKPLELALANIGFTEKEAKVYLSLLRLGASDAKDISTASGIKKPTTYVILEELRKKDAVLFLPNAKKKLFSAKNPDDVFDLANKRFNHAFSHLPLLNSLAKNSKEKAMVTYYEGPSGYTQAMHYKEEEVIEAGELLCYFATDEHISAATLPNANDYLNRLKKQKIKVRAFGNNTERMKNYREKDAEFYREVKILPPNTYDARSSIEISQTFIRFTLFEQEIYVVIDNPEIARVMRQIFEMNWAKY